MPIQTPQWTDFLICPVCENGFELKTRLPISLGCGHSVCKTCLANLQRNVCPFDQTSITIPLERLPVNTALVLLVDPEASLKAFRTKTGPPAISDHYSVSMQFMEQLAAFLRPSNAQPLSRPMQRKLVALINCQLLEDEGRGRAIRSARSLGERSVTELILQHQNPQQLSANLWAAVRTRGCQFLGPAMQEEVLKLVLLALEDGSALSRKVLVMFVVQRLEPHFPQASKTSIGHVVQLLYRASCFIVTKREGDSSLMQLKDEFRTYESLRREHDAQIVQVATEAGLRIAPDQWSSLLYGDTNHKSHMQSIIDKLQTPQSFVQSVQELVIALQRTGDPGKLTSLRPHLDFLSALDTSSETICSDWTVLEESLNSCCQVTSGLLKFISLHSQRRTGEPNNASTVHTRYKTSMCRDLTTHSSCPRGKHCTFAHSQGEIEQFRQKRGRLPTECENQVLPLITEARSPPQPMINLQQRPSRLEPSMTPVAQVVPVPREMIPEVPPPILQVMAPPPPNPPPPPPMYENYGPVSIVHAMPGPPPDLMVPGPGMVPVIGPMPNGQMGSVMSPPIQLHYSQLIPAEQEWCQVIQNQQMQEQLGEFQRQSAIAAAVQAKTMHNLATKSLSALKSRKDEIIDSLEDLVGKDETKKISHVTSERATTLQNLQNLTDDRGAYSMWNNQYMCNPPPPLGIQIGEERELERPSRPEDDLIPFSDTPQISRFGPISRRIICPQSLPTQSQAIIGEETRPTSVVRHSKHMSRPVPVAASLLHQNGTRTTLQPVAVGMNGEIGYIAIAEAPVVMGTTTDMTMQHLHQSTMVSPVHLTLGSADQNMDPQTTGLMAESERMRHRLEILQMKISSLNLARINGMPPPPQQYSEPICGGGEKEQLTSELQLIENSIQDREREIKINHQRNETATTDE